MNNKFLLAFVAFLLWPVAAKSAVQLTNANTNYAYIDLNSTNQILNLSSSSWSISLWFNAQATSTYTPNSTENMAGWDNTTVNNPLLNVDISATTGNMRCVIRDDAGNLAAATWTGTTYHNDGLWHHVVGIHVSTTAYLYVDGVFRASASIAGYGVTSVNFFEIGGMKRAAPGSGFQGKIDDVAVYNRALGTNEISNLYTSRTRNMNTDGRVAYYPLDNGNDGVVQSGANTVLDRSGNNLHLSPSNSAGSAALNLTWKASTWINYP